MEKWRFNTPLFSRLSEVMDLTGTEIARRCGLRQQVLSRYTTNERVVSIQVLIKLCNAIRMPIYYFVTEDHSFIIPNRESVTIPLDQWKPVSWNFDNVEKIFGDGEGQINWKDVAEVMGVTSQKPHGRFSLHRRFKVTDFFAACNAFNLSPFLFLNDPNRPDSSKRKRQKKDRTPPPSYTELSHRIDALEQNIADLTQKYKDLLQAHEALAKRVQVNIQNVQNSHIGINDHLGMAAERRPDER